MRLMNKEGCDHAHGAQQTMVALDHLTTSVEEEESASSVRAFGLTFAEALVADQSALLVTD
jgi:hypothetical protein